MAECIFCKIVNNQAEADRVFEDDQVVVFRDINPKAPVHVLVTPRKHLASLNEASEDDAALLGHMLLVAARVAKEQGIADSGYKVVNNVGEHGGQIIQHLHLHVVGGHHVKALV